MDRMHVNPNTKSAVAGEVSPRASLGTASTRRDDAVICICPPDTAGLPYAHLHNCPRVAPSAPLENRGRQTFQGDDSLFGDVVPERHQNKQPLYIRDSSAHSAQLDASIEDLLGVIHAPLSDTYNMKKWDGDYLGEVKQMRDVCDAILKENASRLHPKPPSSRSGQ